MPIAKSPILKIPRNSGELIAELRPIIGVRASNRLQDEVNSNVIGLFKLGEMHFHFASQPLIAHGDWRQIVSRAYYGVYNVVRAIKLNKFGVYSTDVSDHKEVQNLPDDFPNHDSRKNILKQFRDDRNTADYDHDANESDLNQSASNAVAFSVSFIVDARAYLQARGVNV